MIPRENNIGVLVVNIPGMVTEIREQVITLKNDKETPYRIGSVEVKYPNGEMDTVDARFYVNSILAHPEIFRVGSKVNLEVQVEGDYAGRAVAKLGGNLVDISKLLGSTTKPKEMAKSPTISSHSVEEHVVDKEMVI